MLVVETISKIRRAYFQEKKKIKEICRDFRVSRNTVGELVFVGSPPQSGAAST
jgi:DNA-binding transcriptional regulator LsrR (DeoR family)